MEVCLVQKNHHLRGQHRANRSVTLFWAKSDWLTFEVFLEKTAAESLVKKKGLLAVRARR